MDQRLRVGQYQDICSGWKGERSTGHRHSDATALESASGVVAEVPITDTTSLPTASAAPGGDPALIAGRGHLCDIHCGHATARQLITLNFTILQGHQPEMVSEQEVAERLEAASK